MTKSRCLRRNLLWIWPSFTKATLWNIIQTNILMSKLSWATSREIIKQYTPKKNNSSQSSFFLILRGASWSFSPTGRTYSFKLLPNCWWIFKIFYTRNQLKSMTFTVRNLLKRKVLESWTKNDIGDTLYYRRISQAKSPKVIRAVCIYETANPKNSYSICFHNNWLKRRLRPPTTQH